MGRRGGGGGESEERLKQSAETSSPEIRPETAVDEGSV